MTKEEKIKEAWGELWNSFNESAKKYALNKDGYVASILQNGLNKDFTEFDTALVAWRPKSLKGIEDNNGWISLSGDPNEIEWVENLELYNIKTKEHYFCTDEHEFIEIGRFTHYKPIVKSKPPLY